MFENYLLIIVGLFLLFNGVVGIYYTFLFSKFFVKINTKLYIVLFFSLYLIFLIFIGVFLINKSLN